MTQWKLVPVEPTHEMIRAVALKSADSWATGLKAAIDAAPAPDAKPVALMNIYPDGRREFHNGKDNDADYAVPVYLRPPAADVQKLVEPVALEKVYETIIQWDKGGGKRSRRELAKQIIDLYIHPPTADVSALVEALQYVIRGVPDTWDGVIKAKEVLSKWEGK